VANTIRTGIYEYLGHVVRVEITHSGGGVFIRTLNTMNSVNVMNGNYLTLSGVNNISGQGVNLNQITQIKFIITL